MESTTDKHEEVKEFYGKTLTKTTDLKTDACCPKGKALYKSAREAVKEVHDEVIKKYYGCGNPIPERLKDATVLDLGCGTGRDVYITSKLVGANGKVIGLDMTEEQLATAREYQEYHAEKFGFANTEFIESYIEDLVDSGKVAEGTVDVVISNCVVNLCPNKAQVFKQVWKALKEGGELYFSDIYCDRRVPKEIKENKDLWGEGLSGALYYEDFRRLMADTGFKDLRIVSQDKVNITGSFHVEPNYYSITVRALKLSSLEDKCEDYQNTVTYKGGIPDFESKWEFDQHYTFDKDTAVSVCRNTAEILRHSRYSEAFEVSEDGVHQGLHSKQNFTVNLEAKSGDCCPSTDKKESSACCPPSESKEATGCCSKSEDKKSGCC